MELPHEGLRVGRYELVRRLGAGGMGEVWEALLHGPEGFRRPVALKLLAPSPGRPPDGEGLVREARLGALVSHPNVVATHDVGEADGRWYLAMELVRGPTLAEVRRRGPIPASALVDAGLQVCAGLAHLHDLHVDGRPADLVHRDLKPSNLLVDRGGRVKIVDLGIAGSRAEGDEVTGTPGYLAPEQAEGREERRSDLFSLGVTLFVLATGAAPFGTGTRALLELANVERRLAEGLCGRVDEVAPGLGPVVHRCLRADPEDRWPDAGALASALQEVRGRLRGESLAQLIARTHPDPAADAPTGPRAVRERASLRTVALAPGNLPPQRDIFVGRREEVADLARRARAGEPLVVLKGMGGAGKTRLSLAVAREVAADLPGGSWFVELADATTADGVCAAVARALQVPLAGGDAVAQLGRALAFRGRALVVLDNAEQVAHALPGTLGRWLELAPEATFLVTTRVALRLQGERPIELGPLSNDEAVELFLDRSARPPPASERPAVAALVDELERLPLALELAAARTRVLSIREIRAQLVDRLGLLSGGDPDRPERQRSLAASLEGSWALATRAAREALTQLAVFEGGFTLGAAEGVVDLRGLPDARWMVDVLAELADASLVRADPDGARFRLPVVVREWAAARATDPGATERRHGAWFAQWGDEATVAWFRKAPGATFRAVIEDLDNLVAACRRALARGDVPVAAGTCHAAATLLAIRGPLAPLVELATAVLALPGLPPADRRRAWAALATAHADRGAGADSERARAEALALGRAQGHLPTVVAMLGMEARVQQRLGLTDAAAVILAEALAAAEAAGPEVRANAVLHQGLVHLGAGRLLEAREALEQALELAGRLDDPHREATCLNNLGLVELYLGDLARAEERMAGALGRCLVAGDRRGELVARANLGAARLATGRLDEARAAWLEDERAFGAIGDTQGVATMQLQLGHAAHEAGRPDEARRRLDRALDLRRRMGNVYGEMQVRTVLAAVELAAGDLDGAEQALDPAATWGECAAHHQLLLEVETWRALLALARGRVAEAEACAARAAGASAAMGKGEPQVAWVTGLVHAAAGRADEAAAALRRAADGAEGSHFSLAMEARLELALVTRDLALLDEATARCAAGGFERLRSRGRAIRTRIGGQDARCETSQV